MKPVVFVETWYNDPITNTITRIRTPTDDIENDKVIATFSPSSTSPRRDTPRLVTVVPELTWKECIAKDGLQIDVTTQTMHAVEEENATKTQRRCGSFCIIL